MVKKEREKGQDKESPAASQRLIRGLMVIEFLSNYP
ncbi:IclR family transcriptional regulator, partial [Klebsiella pneumoniae]|nr:IclR family transcriptional regulator [Klebsiella pneumoniae]